MTSASRFFYLAPDIEIPSFAQGLLHGHVRLLRASGHEASVLYQQQDRRLAWLDTDGVPTHTFERERLTLTPHDVLVVPIVRGHPRSLDAFACRRVAWVHGCQAIVPALGAAETLSELGFERAWTASPEVERGVRRFFPLPTHVVPPFVAPYFFDSAPKPLLERPRTLLLYQRPGLETKLPDLSFFERVIVPLTAENGWQRIHLSGLSHTDCAKAMSNARVLVNLTPTEAYNGPLMEAMAAGCLAVGYRDQSKGILRHRQNALVFPNNYIFPLVEEVARLVVSDERATDQLQTLTAEALRTVQAFTVERTRSALSAALEALDH